jgi:hypothetical protein
MVAVKRQIVTKTMRREARHRAGSHVEKRVFRA